MKIVVHQIPVPLDYDETVLLENVATRLSCDVADLRNVEIVRRSLDARPRHPEPHYVLSVAVEIDRSLFPNHARPNEIQMIKDEGAFEPLHWSNTANRPIVIGAGPAGIMAAHTLAKAGAKPILLERGDAVITRRDKAGSFWTKGELDPESNVLFGEGGAGLFSDGKLTARTKDRRRCLQFLKLLVQCGAPESILADAEPHVGSDLLQHIVPRVTQQIEQDGGEVRFNARLERLFIEKGTLRGMVVNGEEIPCTHSVLAAGHSARDLYAMLAETGVELQARPIAVGVRLEMPQNAIDAAQYGKFAGDPRLGAASFRLTRKAGKNSRSCYSFCMCPGGQVIACASEPHCLTTNGMSYSNRSLGMGNAAFLVPAEENDFPHGPVAALSGIAFQRAIEMRAYTAGGGTYALPACRLADFLSGNTISSLPEGMSAQQSTPVDLSEILPDFVTATLRVAIPPMLKELNSVLIDDTIVYAAETRSSSTVRIVRDRSGRSINVVGLYPAGEGSGYAGGIVSSAIDGIKAAEACLSSFK